MTLSSTFTAQEPFLSSPVGMMNFIGMVIHNQIGRNRVFNASSTNITLPKMYRGTVFLSRVCYAGSNVNKFQTQNLNKSCELYKYVHM
jgi:hypothetical protein